MNEARSHIDPDGRYADDVCQGCAEKHLGVVH